MKKVKYLLLTAGLLFITAGILAAGMFIGRPTSIKEHAAASTNLSIAPSSQNINSGQDVTFSVLMDTGSNSITGVDLELNFDPNIIQISSLKKGTGVPDLNNTISNNFDNNAGKIFYTIFTLDKTKAVQGSGIEVLQVKAKATNTAAAGSYTVTFDPTTAVSATGESENALVGTVRGTLIVSAPTPTATATPTASPTDSPGAPNSCGGTCGSNFNCGSNLYCYQGYCRNPNCSWSNDCSCNTAPTPTPTATPAPRLSNNATQRPRATSPPTVVELTPEPAASQTPVGFWENVFTTDTTPTPTLVPVNLPADKSTDFLPYIIGSLIVAGVTLIFIVIGILKELGRKRAKPPLIKV